VALCIEVSRPQRADCERLGSGCPARYSPDPKAVLLGTPFGGLFALRAESATSVRRQVSPTYSRQSGCSAIIQSNSGWALNQPAIDEPIWEWTCRAVSSGIGFGSPAAIESSSA
jgi:hypothetical protein